MTTHTIEIYDDFLSQEDHKIIHDKMMNMGFAWEYSNNKVYNLPTTICRFYNVYGPHQILDGAYAAVIGIFENQYNAKKTLTVTGDGEQRRDFTHVDDIVDGLVKCATNMDVASGKIFELGRGTNHSILQITEMFGEEEVEYIPARPGEMRVTLCESLEARELLGWTPKIDIEDYIKSFLKTT